MREFEKNKQQKAKSFEVRSIYLERKKILLVLIGRSLARSFHLCLGDV